MADNSYISSLLKANNNNSTGMFGNFAKLLTQSATADQNRRYSNSDEVKSILASGDPDQIKTLDFNRLSPEAIKTLDMQNKLLAQSRANTMWNQQQAAYKNKLEQNKEARNFYHDLSIGPKPDSALGGILNNSNFENKANGAAYSDDELAATKGINMPMTKDNQIDLTGYKQALLSHKVDPKMVDSIINKTQTQQNLSNFANKVPSILQKNNIGALTNTEFINKDIKNYHNLPLSVLSQTIKLRQANLKATKAKRDDYAKQLATLDKNEKALQIKYSKAADGQVKNMQPTAGTKATNGVGSSNYNSALSSLLAGINSKTYGDATSKVSTLAIQNFRRLAIQEGIDPKVAKVVVQNSIKLHPHWYKQDDATFDPQASTKELIKDAENRQKAITGKADVTAFQRTALAKQIRDIEAQKKAIADKKVILGMSPAEKRNFVLKNAYEEMVNGKDKGKGKVKVGVTTGGKATGGGHGKRDDVSTEDDSSTNISNSLIKHLTDVAAGKAPSDANIKSKFNLTKILPGDSSIKGIPTATKGGYGAPEGYTPEKESDSMHKLLNVIEKAQGKPLTPKQTASRRILNDFLAKNINIGTFRPPLTKEEVQNILKLDTVDLNKLLPKLSVNQRRQLSRAGGSKFATKQQIQDAKDAAELKKLGDFVNNH